MLSRFPGAAIAAAFLVAAGACQARAETVGKMVDAERNVYGTPPGQAQAPMRKGDPVAFQETIETLDRSSGLVRFIDDSKLTIGAKTKVLIDAFVFDPSGGNSRALLDIAVGVLRFTTGEMPKGGTTIKTPTATVVLRGTDVLVLVRPNGTTTVDVREGSVSVHNDEDGSSMTLEAGQAGTSGPDGNQQAQGGSVTLNIGQQNRSDRNGGARRGESHD